MYIYIHVAGYKAGKAEPSMPSNTDVKETTGFGVCPAEVWACFSLVFPHYTLIPPFWNGIYVF